MIVRLEADGAVVADADDCSAVHVQTTLGPRRPARGPAAHRHGLGARREVPRSVVLDIAVLRSRAALVATDPDWAERFDALVASSGERLTDDGLGLRVAVERPAA